MRVLSYIIIALGVYLLACTTYDEVRGITHKPVISLRMPGTGRFNVWYLYSIPVHRDQNPRLFRQFIVTHWIYAIVVEGLGCILYLKTKAQDEP
jgi:hypothetical protein